MSVMIRSRSPKPPDRRVRRTQVAIVSAFNRLILERGYAALTPGDVAAAADVGRSTFYEHFSGLDDLLAQTLGPVLSPLARGCLETGAPDAAVRATEHLWENRRLARALLSGDAYAIVERTFAALVTSALAEGSGRGEMRVEAEIVGLQLAAGHLAALSAWLAGRSGHTAKEIAGALHASGRALILAMCEPASDSERE